MMANKANVQFQASQDYIENSFHPKGKVRRRGRRQEKKRNESDTFSQKRPIVELCLTNLANHCPGLNSGLASPHLW